MNTMKPANPPHLFPMENDEYELVLEDYEFMFPKKQLKEIQDRHNAGEWITEISKAIQRHEIEVLMAVVHLHTKGKITKELAFRNK